MIYIECNADFALLNLLTKIPRRQISHELKGGRGSICNRLARTTNCIGLIDEDPSSAQPGYLKETRQVQDLPELGIKVLLHSSDNNYIILLCPYLEAWVLKAAKDADIDIKRYNLPDNAVKLHSVINLNLDKFERLLTELTDSSRLKRLKSILTERIS